MTSPASPSAPSPIDWISKIPVKNFIIAQPDTKLLITTTKQNSLKRSFCFPTPESRTLLCDKWYRIEEDTPWYNTTESITECCLALFILIEQPLKTVLEKDMIVYRETCTLIPLPRKLGLEGLCRIVHEYLFPCWDKDEKEITIDLTDYNPPKEELEGVSKELG